MKTLVWRSKVLTRTEKTKQGKRALIMGSLASEMGQVYSAKNENDTGEMEGKGHCYGLCSLLFIG